MKSNTYQLTTSDGLKLYGKYWTPDSNLKGVITWVHGMGEHIERYEHVAKVITEAGYAIVGYDHRGHGRSEGNRGHIPSYEQFMDDLTLVFNQSSNLFPNIPHFIYGHSMGGGLVANYLERRKPQVKAALLSAPYFRLATPQPAIKLALGRLTQNLVPKLALPTGLNPQHISRDAEVVKKYISDPLVHDKVSAKMGISLIENGEYAIAHAGDIQVPTLVLHGTGDQLTDCKASEEFAKKGGSLIQIKLYKGLFHEIHNEPEKDIVFKDIIDWLNNHL
ncbi:MAG: alpha/beta hydrolase [Chitinophagales bacterium]|nr:lysophospholipase [Chitinophagales bacterium]MCZ2394154.1 alpha/beta hydrolase [Chitinophagales bacterium]